MIISRSLQEIYALTWKSTIWNPSASTAMVYLNSCLLTAWLLVWQWQLTVEFFDWDVLSHIESRDLFCSSINCGQCWPMTVENQILNETDVLERNHISLKPVWKKSIQKLRESGISTELCFSFQSYCYQVSFHG
jgi:hypothetical protein